MKIVTWDEPFGPGTVHCWTTVENAVAYAKERAVEYNHIYTSDGEALEDFLEINWAWIEEGEDE